MGLMCMKTNRQKGFTLVELMIALLLSGLVATAMAFFFRNQQETYTAQEEVAEMQEELRASMEIISRELRNAGHDSTDKKTLVKNDLAGILEADPFHIQFSMDLVGDPLDGGPDKDVDDANENVAFGLRVDAVTFDADGIADAGVTALGRRATAAGNIEELASNIHAIGFAYAYDSDGDGDLETTDVGGEKLVSWAVPSGGGAWNALDSNNDGIIDAINDAIPAAGLATPAQLRQIRAIRIWLLARASRPDPKYVDSNTYKVGMNVITPNDNFRRRLLNVSIRCRNQGIQVPI